jgi:hypothetical protein
MISQTTKIYEYKDMFRNFWHAKHATHAQNMQNMHKTCKTRKTVTVQCLIPLLKN